MSANKDPEEKFLVSFSDIFSILRGSKIKIFFFALAFSLIAVGWSLTKPIQYKADGTFREKGIKQSSYSPSTSILQLFSHSGGGTESEAASLMTSRTILRDVIDQLHLQGYIESQEDVECLSKRAKNNLLLEWRSLKNHQIPILKDLCCPLQISSLTYTGEIPLSFKLQLDEKGRFQVYDNTSKALIGEGKLGELYSFEQFSFTLTPTNSSEPIHAQSYNLSINPFSTIVESIIEILKVNPSKKDKSLLVVEFQHRDRHLASKMVNTLMESYQNYSKKYHTHVAFQQLEYLSQRRDQLGENLIGVMQKHANFLANDLYSSGFIESDKEMDFLAKSQHEYKHKLLENELEIKRLINIKLDNFAHYDRYTNHEGDASTINNIFSEMRSLKQQRDTLQIETQKNSINQGMNLQEFFEQQVKELNEVQHYLAELREIKDQFQNGLMISPTLKILDDPRYLLKSWFEHLQNAQNNSKNWKEAQDSLQHYLNNLERLFGVQERILQERLTHQQNPSSEYQGINLEVATDLYRDYSKQLIQMESTIRQNIFFINQIEDPNFEITSLSAGLNDPISHEIIQKASQLLLRLRDQNNQSVREQERIKEELNLERTFLTLHLQQMVQIMELNKQLIDEKIFALQNVSLELIHQHISLLEKNLQDYLQARLNNLEQERILIKRHLENIHGELAQLPQKWVSEQLLTQEVKTSQMIVEEIAKLVETKNISHNLEILQSAPVDLAFSPVHPIPPKLTTYTILGALLGILLGGCFVLAKSFDKEPPPKKED